VRTLMLLLLCACSSTSGEVAVLSYNVHGLPAGITGDDTESRLERIGPLLEPYDLIGLQEVWMYDTWDGLRAGTNHEYILRQNDPINEERVYGSGLVTLSRSELIATDFTYFTTCNGVLDNGSDCLASKGFQRMTLEVGGRPVVFFNSHLDASGGEEDERARAAQVEQLIEAMNDVPSDTAIVFTGDTNLHDDGVDMQTIERWMEQSELVDACIQSSCDDPGNIDKILIRSSDSLTLTATNWRVEPWLDDNGVHLSDHEPIGIDLTWTR
jgi:endonuclease/exonuclease/phosphatase family metal-dependent hydrolase